MNPDITNPKRITLGSRTAKKIAGFSLLGFAVLTWVVAASLPFLGLTLAQTAIGTTIIVVLGEGAFWLSMFFLGSQYWHNVKQFFRCRFSSNKEGCASEI